MKKFICFLVICIIGCCVMVGCTSMEGVESDRSGSTTKINNNDVFEFVDPDTGVHYWIYSHEHGYAGMGGMTPRLNTDGTIMVTGK